MIDLRFIRDNIDLVKKGSEAKGIIVNLDDILSHDDRRRLLIQEGESLKARKNTVSAEVGKLKKQGLDASTMISEMDSVKDRIQAIDNELREVEAKLNSLLLTVPNIPHPSVPVGKTPADNKETFRWGELSPTDF